MQVWKFGELENIILHISGGWTMTNCKCEWLSEWAWCNQGGGLRLVYVFEHVCVDVFTTITALLRGFVFILAPET